MQKLTNNGTLTVPVPNHKELAKGTLKSVIMQSRVAPGEFMTR